MPYGKGRVEQGNFIYSFIKLDFILRLRKKDTINILTWPLQLLHQVKRTQELKK